MSMIFTGALVLGAASAPALAAPKGGPPKGKAEKRHSSGPKPSRGRNATPPAVTEDNDDDGVPNNIVDGGDNRHPSGRDRSVEKGGSVNQGRSGSDPDRGTNGGADKPGGRGGLDRIDQDGNNGCGNDDDFEDDNNGRCGGKRRNSTRGNQGRGTSPENRGRPGSVPGGTGTGGTGASDLTVPSAVLGVEVLRPGDLAAPATLGSLLGGEPGQGARVLGVEVSRGLDPRASISALANTHEVLGRQPASSGSLPRTGWSADGMTQVALMLLGAGGTVVLASRRQPAVARTR
ncbi:MAG: hypothetical protein M3N31_02695 [Actinomycetota bacterium]|nr:hypothetical protein [Actinomycetota bacterium]